MELEKLLDTIIRRSERMPQLLNTRMVGVYRSFVQINNL